MKSVPVKSLVVGQRILPFENNKGFVVRAIFVDHVSKTANVMIRPHNRRTAKGVRTLKFQIDETVLKIG